MMKKENVSVDEKTLSGYQMLVLSNYLHWICGPETSDKPIIVTPIIRSYDTQIFVKLAP